jgi:hypothetical protein
MAYRRKEIQFETIREFCSLLLHHLESFIRRFQDTIAPKMSSVRNRYHKSRWHRPKAIEHSADNDDHEHPAKQLEEVEWDLDRLQHRIVPSDRNLYIRLLAVAPQIWTITQQSKNAVSSSYFGPPPMLSRGWTLAVALTLGGVYSAQKGYAKFDGSFTREEAHATDVHFLNYFFIFVKRCY